jgi:alpha-L-arabinofuranosidase
VESFKTRLASELESLENLSAEVWAFIETEMKSGLETEYRVTEVETSRGLEKAEVVRLGHYAMFAALPKGEVQEAHRAAESWTMKPVESDSRKQEVLRLINNVKSKRKSGLYSDQLFGESL